VGAYVAFDGEVYPCVEWRESCGSIIKPGFKKIWRESPVLSRARELKISCFKGCSVCKYMQRCNMCAGLNYQDTGDPFKPSFLACERAKAYACARGE
jgi:radical SAM protein with 4Fe4S-binding SPASM domain